MRDGNELPSATPATNAPLPAIRGHRPSYVRVFATFLRNALVREMTFRTNFLINLASEFMWFGAMLVFYLVIYTHTNSINGWTRYEYFAFMATAMLVNATMETFFLPNASHFSELVRTGNLDFVLLKPLDTQFLVSLQKVDFSPLGNALVAIGLLIYCLVMLGRPITIMQVALYVGMLAVGIAIFYSFMLILASTSVWMGRNRGLQEFWFSVTVFARYPRDIYTGVVGNVVRLVFSYVLPVLLVITVPAEVIARAFDPRLILVAVGLAVVFIFLSRRFFHFALRSYRSASS